MSSTEKKIHAVAIVLFACMVVGADGCWLSSCERDPQRQPPKHGGLMDEHRGAVLASAARR